MKNTASTLLLATLLAAPAAFAQDAAPAADATTEATDVATAEATDAAAPVAEAAPAAEAATTAEAAPAAEAAATAEVAPAAEEAPYVSDAPSPMAEPAVAPAPAPITSDLPTEVTSVIGTPEAGKGMVVFFRPKSFVGAALGFKVRENDNELGKLRNGNWFAVQVEPGAHAYVVHSEAKDVTNLEIEEGETYFLSLSISMGFMAGRPNLTPTDAMAFQSVMDKLKPSKPLE